MKKAYHEWRAPVLVNSNWWLCFLDDCEVKAVDTRPTGALGTPANTAPNLEGDGWAGVMPWQVRRAAWIIWRILDFKDKLAR